MLGLADDAHGVLGSAGLGKRLSKLDFRHCRPD